MANEAPVGRVYRMKLWWRGFTVAYLAFALVFLGSVVTNALSGAKEPTTGDIIGSVILSIAGLAMAAHAFTSVLSFTREGVKLQSIFRTRTLPLTAIRGRREYVSRGTRSRTRYIKLESDDDRFASLEIAKSYYTFDESFWAWFNALPDLDLIEKQRENESKFGLV